MRVVAVGDGLFEDRRGGGRRYLSEIAGRLCARGHHVEVVVPRLRPSLPPCERVDGARVLRHETGSGPLPAALLARYRSAQRAFRQAVSEGCDLVNVHFAQTAFAALRSPEASGLPVVYNFQGPWPGEVWVERRAGAAGMPWGRRAPRYVADMAAFGAMFMMERAVARRADRFIVLSAFSRDTLRRWYGIPPELVAVIPSGVDTERFSPHPMRDLLRDELGFHRETRVLFTARRLVARMGLELLLEAVQSMAGGERMVLCIAGDGPLRGPLERRAAALGVDHLVRWLGGISEEELVSYYRAADLVVVPTVAYEGFGLVTVEALACGTPVVATPVGASPEILSGLQPELVSTAADPAALASAIQRALAEAPDREECRRYAEERYCWEVVFPRVEGEFLAAMHSRPPAFAVR